jgi:hypothetical protein
LKFRARHSIATSVVTMLMDICAQISNLVVRGLQQY